MFYISRIRQVSKLKYEVTKYSQLYFHKGKFSCEIHENFRLYSTSGEMITYITTFSTHI